MRHRDARRDRARVRQRGAGRQRRDRRRRRHRRPGGERPARPRRRGRVADRRRRRARPVGRRRRDHVPAGHRAARRRRGHRDAAAGLEAARPGRGGRARRRRRRRQARGRGVRGLARRRSAVRGPPHPRSWRPRCGCPLHAPGVCPPGTYPKGHAPQGHAPLLGLFSGGSLAYEAQTILGPGHRILDLGDEEYTQGRPHPMVDLELRRRMLREDGPAAGCVLLDVVLGYGSHPDPAGELAETLAELECPVIAHVCGTDADPQDAGRQEAILREAGVHVAPTNAAAARLAKAVVG
ncbi:MAG TPA: hypothetical protein VNO82_13060 [Solirubrobacteraceae bacterium]|nr:hypothetical protein [Solirubrobacteraceae bacterium]